VSLDAIPPRKLRIAVVTPVFPTSAEKYRGNYNYNIVLSMQRHAEIEVFCPLGVVPKLKFLHPRTLRYNQVDANYSPGGVRVKYLPYRSVPVLSRPLNGFSTALKLLPHVKDFRPDVILAYWIYPEGFGALLTAQELKVPFIIGALGSDLRQMSDPLSNYLSRHTLAKADHIITVSDEMRRQVIHLDNDPTKVTSVRNGCDREIFQPQDRNAARNAVGILPDAELALFVGWLATPKGLGELLKVMRELLPARPKLMLACIGEGTLAAHVRQLESEHPDRIRLLGPQTSAEVARWLAASTFLVLPSYSEGCPNVVVEALSCGRPVVATDVGGIPELVKDGCGILIPPQNEPALKEAILRVLSQDWDPESIARITRRSWHDVADDTFRICSSIPGRASHAIQAPPRAKTAVRGSSPGRRTRITVVTPMFPLPTEPYRGWPIYSTVLGLQQLADVEVVCPIAQFPYWIAVRPRSFRYHTIGASYKPQGVSAQYIKYSSLPVVGRPFNGTSVERAVLPAIARTRPDLILAYWIYPEGYGALKIARKLGVPFVVGSRGSDMRLPDVISCRMAISTMKHAAAVLTVSSDLRDQAIRYGIPPERVHTILNGVDTKRFHHCDPMQRRLELGFPLQKQLISFIGWLSVTKGVRELIGALRLLAPRMPDVDLAMIGQGPLFGWLKQLNEDDPVLRGRLHIKGDCGREEVASWLAASDLLCLPSYAEGCPNVVLEALASGRPVVGTAVGGITELVNPSNGLLVPPYRAEPLAQALETVLSRDWDHAAIARNSSRDWLAAAEETFAVCEQVLESALIEKAGVRG
jgi:teichuronic acid biosynthesis glycosyltransferase TuaC